MKKHTDKFYNKITKLNKIKRKAKDEYLKQKEKCTKEAKNFIYDLINQKNPIESAWTLIQYKEKTIEEYYICPPIPFQPLISEPNWMGNIRFIELDRYDDEDKRTEMQTFYNALRQEWIGVSEYIK